MDLTLRVVISKDILWEYVHKIKEILLFVLSCVPLSHTFLVLLSPFNGEVSEFFRHHHLTVAHIYCANIPDVRTFADHIGIRLPAEEDLLWIARCALTAAVPPPWLPVEDNTVDPGKKCVIHFECLTKYIDYIHFYLRGTSYPISGQQTKQLLF